MRQYKGHFKCPSTMSAIISNCRFAVDTLSNTAESEKTNNLIDDPDRDLCDVSLFKRMFFH